MQDNPFSSPESKGYSGNDVNPHLGQDPKTGMNNTVDSQHLFMSPRSSLREEAIHRSHTKREEYATPTSSFHPLAHSISNSSSTTTSNAAREGTPESLAQSARKEWQQHGTGVTQALEEIRRRDEERPGTVTARLFSAETRKDVTGKKYTAYLLRVRLANNQVLQIEHRYSEFAKLNDKFKDHGIQLEASFPKKHLAGRIGNWTPSLRWAPEQHLELIEYRKIQLDVWLVAVLERYNIGDLPYSLAKSIYEFLTISDRPPCDLENIIEDNTIRWHNPISFTLGSSLRQACRIVEEMCTAHPSGLPLKDSDQSIPLDLLHCAKGLIFLNVVKAGLVVSGRVGTGLLISRVDEPQRWSAPCAIGTIGMGWGALAGADITHYLVVLTTQEAVEAMLSGTVQLGTELGIAVGPVGRSSQVSTSPDHTQWTLHSAYSYAHSQGLFVGMSLEGSILSTRHDVNAKFYGRSGLSGEQVLDMPPPKAAEPLYTALERALAIEIPEDGFRPSQLFQDKSDRGVDSSVRAYRDADVTSSSCSTDGVGPIDSYGRVSVSSPNI